VKKHKNKIITGAIIVCVLTLSFILGGGGESAKKENPESFMNPGNSESAQTVPLTDDEAFDTAEAKKRDREDPEQLQAAENSESGNRNSESTQAAPTMAGEVAETAEAAESSEAAQAAQAAAAAAKELEKDREREDPEQLLAAGNNSESGNRNPEPTEAKTEVADSPDEAGQPGEFTVTLIISVATILDNMHRLADGKAELIPSDGIIFKKSVIFYEGESVFNVLQRETKRNRIHMESVNTPFYNSAYVEGINNIYEFDVGERSGWMYSVNGAFPNYGSSRCILNDGDVIKWLYTCDRGADIGGGDAVSHYVFGG